jgi:hypothetical protein
MLAAPPHPEFGRDDGVSESAASTSRSSPAGKSNAPIVPTIGPADADAAREGAAIWWQYKKLPPTRLQPKSQLSREVSRFVVFRRTKKLNEINAAIGRTGARSYRDSSFRS